MKFFLERWESSTFAGMQIKASLAGGTVAVSANVTDKQFSELLIYIGAAILIIGLVSSKLIPAKAGSAGQTAQ